MNKLFSERDNISAIDYPADKQEKPSVEYLQFEAGQTIQDTLLFTEIILVTEGAILLSYDHFLDRKIDPGKILLLPPGCHYTARVESAVSLFVFRIKEAVKFCQGYFLKDVPRDKNQEINQLYDLKVKPPLEVFTSFLNDNIQSGLRHEEYLRLKSEELLYLLRLYYNADELRGFFFPLLSTNVQFHQFVLRYYRKVKTVKDFAELNNCSVSNFDKKFRKAFGTSAYQWMQQKKVDLLYHEINATSKPLRQIATEQKFLSLSQFNDYCKKHFGYPPGKMRKLASMFRPKENVL